MPSTRPLAAIILWHALSAVLIQSVWFAISAIMPVLARKRFDAGDWQTLFITASVPTFLIMSIFWNVFLQRWGLRRYLLLHGASVCVPLIVAATATRYEVLLLGHMLAAIGISGWSPASGDVIKRLYPQSIRGRAFAGINTACFIGMTLFSYLLGRALDWNEDSFRLYLPLAAAAYGSGIIVLRRLIHRVTAETSPAAAVIETAEPWHIRQLFASIVHLRQVLAADRAFYMYEAAFMTYGIGWMIGNALLPVFATDRLHLSYGEFATWSQSVYALGLLALTFPMGWLMDRIGPARTSVVAFAWLTSYPILLMLASHVHHLAFASAMYGGAMAAVNLTWMLGPVTLAPTPEKVAHYVAIHTTLVGFRGVVAQGIGMLLYRLTGSFEWPFGLAAAAFLAAAWQMSALARSLQKKRMSSAQPAT